MKSIAKIIVINIALWTFVFLSVVFLWFLVEASAHPGANAHGMVPIVIGLGLSVGLLSAVMVTPFWVIFRKAGFRPALSPLMMVPLVNLILLYFVAFSEWKAGPAQES